MAEKISNFPAKPQQAAAVATGGGGPHAPGMEARVVRLEDQFARIEALLHGIDDRAHAIELGAAELKGRLASMPGTWAMIATVVGGQVALAGLLFGALKLGAH